MMSWKYLHSWSKTSGFYNKIKAQTNLSFLIYFLSKFFYFVIYIKRIYPKRRMFLSARSMEMKPTTFAPITMFYPNESHEYTHVQWQLRRVPCRGASAVWVSPVAGRCGVAGAGEGGGHEGSVAGALNACGSAVYEDQTRWTAVEPDPDLELITNSRRKSDYTFIKTEVDESITFKLDIKISCHIVKIIRHVK